MRFDKAARAQFAMNLRTRREELGFSQEVLAQMCDLDRTTISLLPDFYASRVPGFLDDIERAAATVEAGGGTERTANTLRPADAADAITLGAAVAWVRRRVAWVRALLAIVGGAIFGFQLGTWFSVAMIGFAGAAVLYDTSNIIHYYPEDRYVSAAMQLFASIALMFWYVLRLLMGNRN